MISSYPTLANALFGAFKLTKNADIDKYRYFGYGIGFDEKGYYSHPSGGTGRNVITFRANMSSCVHVENNGKDIIILGKVPIQELGEHSLSVEKMYSINFTKINIKCFLSFHYNGANSYLFVNSTETYKLKAKDSEIVPNNLCLGNVSKDFSAINMKKTVFNGHIYDFSVNYDATDIDVILDIHKYLMKKMT